MAGPGVADTSSYNQPAPASPLAVANQAVGLANNAQALKAGQFDLIQKQYGVMHNILGSMVSDPALTTDKVTGQIAHMASLGLITPQMAATESSQATQLGGDPAKLKALVQSHLVQSMSGADQFAQQYGTQTVDQGGSQSVQRVNKLTGQVSPMANGTFATGMSPGDANTNVTVTGADGVPHTMLKGQAAAFLAGQGGAGANAGNALGVAPGQGYTPPMPQGVAGQGVAMPNALGAAPPAPAAPQAPAAPAAPNALGAAPPTAPTPNAVAAIKAATSQPAVAPAVQAPTAMPGVAGPAPGAVAAKTNLGAASGTQLATDLQDAKQLPQRLFPLQQAAGALSRLGPQGTGPGADVRNNLKSYLQTLGVPGLDSSKITDFDTATKYLNQYVMNQGGAGRSDMALGSAQGSNASTKISNAAAQEVVANAIGLERMKATAALQYEKQGGDPSQYLGASAIKNQGYDPRAFSFDMMPPAQQTALIAQLKKDPAQMKAFVASHKAATEAGVLTPPAAAGQ